MRITTEKGQFVGYFNSNDGSFTKQVQRSKHLLRMHNAWAIDSDVVDKLKHLGCRYIYIKDTESNTSYGVMFGIFLNKSISINFGFGPQLALPLPEWDKNNYI
jgi:hypothetical protein